MPNPTVLFNTHVALWNVLSLQLPVERPESPEKAPSEGSQTPIQEDRPGTGKSDRPRSKSPRSPKGGRSKSPREKSPKGSKSRSRTPSAKKRDKSKEKEKPAEITTLPTPPGKRYTTWNFSHLP